MGKVMFGLSVSLDGYIAGKNDDVTEVFAWFSDAWERLHEIMGAAPHPGAFAPLIRKIDEALVGLITGHPDAELGRDAP